MPIRRVFSAFALLSVTLLSAQAQGAVLANYNFDSNSDSADFPLTTSSTFQYNSNVGSESGGPADSGISSGGDNAFLRSFATANDLAAALADDDSLSFTVTAFAGQQLNLESLVFDFGGSNSTSTSQTSNVVVQSSVDGFGTGNTVLFTDSETIVSGAGQTSTPNTGNTLVLTGSQFQGLSDITFQFRFFDTVNGEFVNRLDNVVLNGTVTPIPEPASLALLAFGGVALLTRRRRG